LTDNASEAWGAAAHVLPALPSDETSVGRQSPVAVPSMP